jgi:hypothetical protein
MARGKGNSSGKGPVGTAPFSRAPVKAAVKPTTPNRNPNASGGPIRTGGGVGSNKHIKVPLVGGSSQLRKVAPGMAGNSGRAIGNHTMQGTTVRKDPPLHTPAPNPAPHGNSLTNNVGRGGPGAGRFNHGPSGSQGTYGADGNRQGQIAADRTIVAPGPRNAGGKPLATRPTGSPSGGGGPGGYGFRGGK